ncbi:MAG TPA: dynamin family protein [Bacillota bacterium]|nr:dynamin family protein [Bacillota bacterium]
MSVESVLEHMDRVSVTLDKPSPFLALNDLFLQRGDSHTAAKMKQLADKWNTGEFVLAFCGHFSAGKSTMINTLMGREILPSSPIPTSANVVKIKTGEAKAVAYFKNTPPITFDYVEELEKLKEFCKDGDEVVSVEITCPNDFLVNNACLLDTPGIDSTDAAHKVATESALHLADVVVYMMDYNHVQSELNFQFTKTLKERGKKLFLVINQIDKHFDLELDFSAFRQSVEDAFKHWDVNPDGIFYTTLKVPDHPENQMESLHDELYTLFWQKQDLLRESILASARDLITEHEQFIKDLNQQERVEWEAVVSDVDQEETFENYQVWQSKYSQLESGPENFRKDVLKDIQGITDNANLTPFTIRELASQYIESCQQGFKVGFLFSAGKTQQEKENRLNKFQEAFEDQVRANLVWHLGDLFRQLPKRYDLSLPTEEWEKADQIQIPITAEFLSSHIKSGARMTGDSVLNYCRDLAGEIKNQFRRAFSDLLEEYYQAYKAKTNLQGEALRSEGNQLLVKVEAFRSLQNIAGQEQEYIHQLLDTLKHGEQSLLSATEEATSQEGKKRTLQTKTLSSFTEKETLTSLVLEESADQVSPFKKDYKSQIRSAADRLIQAADSIEGLPGQLVAIRNMRQRAERLQQNLFTVALFGAFSAGKSSFANALMGEMILPVSPNPTTATINKILPPTEEYPHGTVRVKMKNKADMTKDVQQSLAVFRMHAQTIEEAIGQINHISSEDILPSVGPHLSFLKAVRAGHVEMEDWYGKIHLVGMEEFQELVAKEEKACFVEWIELYYACPLTNQGISLVDTPGADSINARHTGVAFEYIKNADAVLFVTYYNHAFSHADREFLQQLGRVKDTFEMDKMFFIVNAADLAKSKEELMHVVDHVKDNLVTCGIRGPRLYPVSSQTALLARMLAKGSLSPSAERVYRDRTGSGDTLMPPKEALKFAGFETFEADFIRFTVEELTQVAINSALGEMRRVKHNLEAYLSSSKQGDEVRKEKLISLERAFEEDRSTLLELKDWHREKEYVTKEARELLYYVKQRLFFKLTDLFALSFNPSVLKDEPGKNGKHLIEQCFDEFVRNITFSLDQEVRATTLRLEKFVNRQAKGLTDELQKAISADIDLVFQEQSWEVPELVQELPYEVGSVRSILSLYKTPKHFFEQGGREAFRVKLEDWLQNPVTNYLEDSMNHLDSFYGEALDQMMREFIQQWKNQVNDYYQGMTSALKDGINIHEIERAYDTLEQLTMEESC